MVCPACQAENKEGARFCNECGGSLAVQCPGCGVAHRAGQKFCDECGTALTVAGAPAVEGGAAAEVGVAPGRAELRLVSVLFVDLVGFTRLSESRAAEDVRELLERYFESARTIVERYGGSIQKFIGDAVMAVWGVPVAREDDAERTVRAALEVVDAVEVFGEEEGIEGLRARGGVVTGQVAALENPGEGLVVGDRVNTASRVQSLAQPGSVFVDEVTRHVTSAAVAYEDAGQHSAKGKVEPLRLWRAVRVVAGVGGTQREQGLEAPFVGRGADLRLLKDLFHGALERRSARLVAVSGEAGVGKSRLHREFSNYVDGLAETFLWHSGRCLSYGDGVAYWALSEMVRQRLGLAENASSQEANVRLAEGLNRWVENADDREFLAPRLGALLGLAEPGLGREELFAGWRLFFERLAAHEPVAMVFEDLQWADAGLLDFIEQLLDWSASSPIFILALARPELVAGQEGWPARLRRATTIQLEPLDDAAMRALLAGVVEGLPERAREQIVAQAQGVPLYAIETVRALADQGVLTELDAGRLVLTGELGQLDVPASLSSLLAARLDALEPVERGLVKAMSVFGGAFPRSAAAALGGVTEDRLGGVLSGLVRKQVLVIRADPLSPDRGQYAFAQGLLRTVAYEMLSRRERKPRHLAAAEHLQRVFANDGEDVAEVIASHYLDAYRAAAGDPDSDQLRDQTLAALRRAAQRAATVGAPDTAERAYRTALELAAEEDERSALTQAAGEMALQSGRDEAALELFEAASSAYLSAGRERDAARIAGRIGLALSRLGRNDEAAERITAALRILESSQLDAEVAALNAGLGRARVFVADYERAGPPLETALRIAEALELPAVLSDALTSKAHFFEWSGRRQEARVLLAGAIEIAGRHNLTEPLVRASGNSSFLAMQWDQPDAWQQLESVLALARRRGDRFQESVAAGNLMTAHLYAGHWDELKRLAAELLEDNQERPDAEDLHYRLAILLALQGEPGSARASLDRLGAWEQTEERETQAMRSSALISVHRAEGNAAEALEHGQRMLGQTIDTLGASNEAVRHAWPETVHAALQLVRLDDARGLLALLAEQPPGYIPPYLRHQLARGSALVAAAEGHHDTVEANLNTAIDGLRDLGYPYWLAVTQTDLAAWLIDQCRASEAGGLLDEAATALQSLGATPALTRAKQVSCSLNNAIVS